MSTIIESRGQRYRMSAYFGKDGKYHLTFTPLSIYNPKHENHTYESAEDCVHAYHANVRFYTGREDVVRRAV